MVSRNHLHWSFRAPNIQARQLYLTGQFNGWERTATPMAEVEPGVWEVSIDLQPGDYRFRYVTDDGRWFTDYAAFGVVRNGFGGWDSVVYVPQVYEAAEPTPGENTLTAEEACRLSELMALVWCSTRKGDSGCGDEGDEFEDLSRTKMRDRTRAVAARATAGPQINHKNRTKRSPSPAGGGQGMKLPKQKKPSCLNNEMAGAL